MKKTLSEHMYLHASALSPAWLREGEEEETSSLVPHREPSNSPCSLL